MKKLIIWACALFVVVSCGTNNTKTTEPLPFDPDAPAYKNPNLSAQERAEDLLSRLTLEQKVSLMSWQSPAIPELDIKAYNWWNEALHGAARAGLATVFPQTIGMAASFDNALVQDVFDIASTEQRIKFIQDRKTTGGSSHYHGLTVWTPNINIFRDPRWGRGQETYGEDPYLTATMGYAVVNGLQGPEDASYNKLHACLKHYAVHSGPESERHRFNAENISWRDMQETYLYAFEKLVRTTDVKEVMCAYNAVDGQPCCGNDKLLTAILRRDWGYKGLVVSDCWAVSDFYQSYGHNVFPGDAAAAASNAVLSGTDLECGASFGTLLEGVKQGRIKEEDINVSVLRVLKARFELGEMDADELVEWNSIPENKLASREHAEVAYKIARESMTLLQNNNNVLPLAKTGLKVAVVGPNAADSTILFGNYNGTPLRAITPLDAIREKIGAENVVYASGCEIAVRSASNSNAPKGGSGNDMDKSLLVDGNDITATLGVIPEADVYVFFGGISPRLEGEEMRVSYDGFMGGDRTTIELPATQREYLAKLRATGKPVVMVSMSGSAIALEPETKTCDAILQAWYGGQEGGRAIADVLFGDYNPGGKLPVTFYKNDAQLPAFEDYDFKGHTYRYSSETPLFAFGFGLSYTTFEYGQAKLAKGKLIIPITNTGSVDGDEVAQMYIKRDSDTEGPKFALRGFKRVSIKAGETVNVEIPFDGDTFKTFNESTGLMEVVSGDHTIFYGPSSDNLKSLSAKVNAKNGKVTVK